MTTIDSSGFRVRVDAQLRQEFIDSCRAQDKTAAQVIRGFMREYVAQYYQGVQGTLFEAERKMDKEKG